MNDSPSGSKSQCKVVSKYFSGKPVMDESLSEFQEKKQSSSGPKKATKPTNKSKPKTLKRIRGQKDIRTAIKPKKNELVTYATDFDKVCKQSGIDVDPEQLQLAIALSKSLQKQDNCDSQSSSSLNSQERTGKIRTTLLEYGFKVPEIKINPSRKKRLRNQNSKLLLTTEVEKQQIISDKYAQVLFEQLDRTKVLNYNNTNDISAIKLYHKATQESYAVLKSNNSYYIDNLIHQSENTIGSLLRDWSQIPGRPPSPIIEPCDINFIEIDLSEDELVTVLSGPIEPVQQFVKIKYMLLKEKTVHSPKIISENIDNNSTIDTKMNIHHIGSAVKEINLVIGEEDGSKTVNCNNDTIEIIDIDDVPKLKSFAQVRSCSPDIFDDEVSSIMDRSIGNTSTICLEIPSACRTVINNDVMDLTDGVNVVSQKVITLSNATNELPNSQLSQASNVTKRKSNDFMEITNCVAGSSQPLIVNNIDLTQNSDDRENTEHKTETEGEIVENMDLTQSSNTDDDLPFVQVSGKKCDTLDDTIILNEDVYSGVNIRSKSIAKEQDNSLDTDEFIDRVLRDKEPVQEITTDRALSPIESDGLTKAITNPITIEIEEDSSNSPEPTIAHTGSKDSTFKKSRSPAKSIEFDRKSKTEIFFEEFVYNHSDNDSKELTEDIVIVSLEDNNNKAESDNEYKDNDIDLTQSTDSEKTVDITHKTRSPEVSYGSLGKKGDVSIDYDEIFDEVIESSASTSKQSDFSSKSVVCDYQKELIIAKSKSNSELISNCSQNSEVFEIVDQEFEYSLNQSKHDVPVENFDLGGISIMNDISNIRRSKSTNNDENLANNDLGKSMSDSLPMVYIKGTKYDPKNADIKSAAQPSIATPLRRNTKGDIITVETPTNSEYVIKTDQVTPFVDYASMTTPERNKELDRFGLKPFKRKRAVQILTHLYNQTHPTIESCSTEDLPSPSKKQKTSNCHQNISPKKVSASKSSMINSPKKTEERINPEDTEKENNVYEITNDTPDIRDIECYDDDWVFQKREKAKLHSCRVPLHIAFHNYVSARLRLREAILRYEPVNIDVIHKELVVSGYRYDPKDLLKFMDKKCITVKTADNSSKNNKKHY